MNALERFNRLPLDEAIALLSSCVAVPDWASALVQARPYADRAALLARAGELMQHWGDAELQQAMSAHPRIGERPTGSQAHAALSRQEQASVDRHDAELAEALRTANTQYEARFGRVFLIRAKGRSGAEILQALRLRLHNNEAQERQASLAQLREITLLRLEGVIGA
ncbi:Uric acid degradation bifunctional protein [Serratia rubidaea]|nr:Uric acid degradation bifunctional protein [Serratia rubidaea]